MSLLHPARDVRATARRRCRPWSSRHRCQKSPASEKRGGPPNSDARASCASAARGRDSRPRGSRSCSSVRSVDRWQGARGAASASMSTRVTPRATSASSSISCNPMLAGAVPAVVEQVQLVAVGARPTPIAKHPVASLQRPRSARTQGRPTPMTGRTRRVEARDRRRTRRVRRATPEAQGPQVDGGRRRPRRIEAEGARRIRSKPSGRRRSASRLTERRSVQQRCRSIDRVPPTATPSRRPARGPRQEGGPPRRASPCSRPSIERQTPSRFGFGRSSAKRRSPSPAALRPNTSADLQPLERKRNDAPDRAVVDASPRRRRRTAGRRCCDQRSKADEQAVPREATASRSMPRTPQAAALLPIRPTRAARRPTAPSSVRLQADAGRRRHLVVDGQPAIDAQEDAATSRSTRTSSPARRRVRRRPRSRVLRGEQDARPRSRAGAARPEAQRDGLAVEPRFEPPPNAAAELRAVGRASGRPSLPTSGRRRADAPADGSPPRYDADSSVADLPSVSPRSSRR